jgi:transcriptional regulator with XRE-family HTH domain
MANSLEIALKGLPKRLKAARKARGFTTRRSFALACDIPPPTYLNHEEGKSEPRVSQLVLYSTVLDVSLMWLILGIGDPLDHHEKAEASKAKLFKAYMNLLEMENSNINE